MFANNEKGVSSCLLDGDSMEDAAALQENKRHGERWFPFDIYPCTIPKDFPQVALHWQNSMELVFVKKGMGMVQVGLEPVTARAGDIFVFAPGILHGLGQLPGESMEYENIIFEVELLGGANDLCYQRYLVPLQSGRLSLPPRLTPGKGIYDRVLEDLEQLERVNRDRGLGYELQVKGLLLCLLSALIAQSDGLPPVENGDTRRLKTVLQYVTDHFSENLPVAEAAAVCQCSPSHFMRWFRQMTGQSFTGYLNAWRLNAAAEALRATEDTVLAVAERTGFKNLSYFNRAFKARFGQTPSEYRSGG